MPPQEALRRLRAAGALRPFLLDGAADADGLGRYSYAGANPRARFRIEAVPELLTGAVSSAPPPQLFSAYKAGQAGHVVAPAAPVWRQFAAVLQSWAPLVGVGLIDYELGRSSERLPRRAAPHELGTAAIDFAAYDAVYRYDAQTAHADILAVDADCAARLLALLSQAPVSRHSSADFFCGPLRSEIGEAEYARRVHRVLEHLRAGDCYQVNLCRRLRAVLPRQSAWAAYLRLRQVAPAPLGCYLELEAPPSGETPSSAAGPILLSNSPELFLRFDLVEGVAETRPIKGTRRRSSDSATDQALAAELCASAKDRAEHIMIVDLLRNDLGRIAEVGSVQVAGLLRRVELPTVHHLVSTVLSRPAAGIGLAELLHALVPGGSITGAPKLAAMKLIDELEPHRRGPFYGAVGWLGPTSGELALCIRTAVVRGDASELVLAVGGGIVLDSTASEEWAETQAKAAAFARALS